MPTFCPSLHAHLFYLTTFSSLINSGAKRTWRKTPSESAPANTNKPIMKSFSGGGSALSACMFSTGPTVYNPPTESTMVSFKTGDPGSGGLPSASSETTANKSTSVIIHSGNHTEYSESGSARVALDELMTGVSFNASDSKDSRTATRGSHVAPRGKVRFSGGGPSGRTSATRLDAIAEGDGDEEDIQRSVQSSEKDDEGIQKKIETIFTLSTAHVEVIDCISSSHSGAATHDSTRDSSTLEGDDIDEKDVVKQAGVYLSDDGAFVFSTG
jgi:hypothetical protein